MNAREVMSAPVVTVHPFVTVRDIVATLIDQHISGVPVVEDGEVLGMVGEGDLVHRYEIGTEDWLAHRTWWQRLVGSDLAAGEYVKSHGGRARDIMSRDLTPIAEETPVARIASIFEARHVRRLPVLRGPQLVGIVTRTDLVRALAAKTRSVDTSVANTDEAIRLQLVAELEKQSWWQAKWCSVLVNDGIVRYRGIYERESDRLAARVAAENVPGVRFVEDNRRSSAELQPMM